MRPGPLTCKAMFCTIAMLGTSVSVLAAETITCTYDARGRVTKVLRTGTVNNNVTTDYEHDKINNRKRVKVTGAL